MTAIIGPSGCGKSTMVRCINRMHEEIPGAHAEGRVLLDDADVYDPARRRRRGAPRDRHGLPEAQPVPDDVDLRQRRRRAAPRAGGAARGKADLHGKVEAALRGAGLWDEVADRLAEPGAGLSGGQQQRLCIARSLAVEPEVILMDEPCSALDPIATLKIEELIDELKQRVTIVIVTHNMQQAARVADRTAFMLERRARRGRPDAGDLHRTRTTRGPRNMSPASSASGDGARRRGRVGRATATAAPSAGEARRAPQGRAHFQQQLQRARSATRSAAST